jgi:hypothetical protein
MSWTDNLKTFDMSNVKPVFPELVGEHQAAAIQLDEDRKFIRTPTGRRFINGLGVSNAIRTLDGLPADGESWHIVVRGNFAMFDLIGAVLELAAPATIARLDISTLGFSRSNIEELCLLLDSKKIDSLSFIYSIYFRSTEKEICHRLDHELSSRGHQVLAMRNHSKVMLFEMSDGRYFVNETSANLRSCRNCEQCCITQDRELALFHRGWMDSLFQQGAK